MEEDIPMEVDFGSVSRGTTSGRGSSDDEASERGIRDAFIRKEERDVMKAKVLVASVMMLCAAAVTVSVYVFAKQNDEHSFEVEVSVLIHHYA